MAFEYAGLELPLADEMRAWARWIVPAIDVRSRRSARMP
jgi:hypothetical protein